ncbi:MAG: hypothetical protein NC092_09205 [Butyrivibrio sp.]|nr:hypothetical protein [Muribaculum sp.]MCM1552853.1 hypothetical protein [Butyrivibrio sp.]
MFHFGNRVKKNQELEELAAKINSNVSNNYKDAAQEYLKKYEMRFRELSDEGALNEKQREYYASLLADFQERMKGFYHKEQKPYWT